MSDTPHLSAVEEPRSLLQLFFPSLETHRRMSLCDTCPAWVCILTLPLPRPMSCYSTTLSLSFFCRIRTVLPPLWVAVRLITAAVYHNRQQKLIRKGLNQHFGWDRQDHDGWQKNKVVKRSLSRWVSVGERIRSVGSRGYKCTRKLLWW